MRMLIIEDDPLLGDGLQRALRSEGYTVDWVTRGTQVMPALAADHFDLLLLDLGLPGQDGMAVLQQLRSSGHQVPVLILSARDRLADRVAGLDAGADDYLIKPFSLDELKARVRARLRRPADTSRSQVEVGPLLIDVDSLSATLHGESLSLSRREAVLLLALARQPGRVVTRDRLEQELYGWSDEVESNALEVHIHHLRKKLGADMIRTMRGVGYSLVQP